MLFQEVVTAINTFNQHSLALDSITENGETTLSELTNIDIKIPLFEGNLVLLGNDRVAEVVDTFEVSANEMTIVGEYRYSPEGLVLQVRDKETAQDILQIHILQTQKDTYSVDIQLAEMVTLKGTAKIQEKKAEIVLGFDITLEIGSLLF
ncbi:MAG: hypothetical protein LBD75_05935 [Candidatus Peribacteria bacterium]|nr:hypothetical protein [Candidatus Peribacteria bacterium]